MTEKGSVRTFASPHKRGEGVCKRAAQATSRARGLGVSISETPHANPLAPTFSPQAERRSNVLSAGVRGPLLLVGFLLCPGSRGKLQHRCGLAFLERGQKNLLAVRHFQDIVMDIRLVLVPLPEDRGRECFDALGLVAGPAKLDGLVEGKLSAGKDTNRRYVAHRIINRFESDGATSEIVAY